MYQINANYYIIWGLVNNDEGPRVGDGPDIYLCSYHGSRLVTCAVEKSEYAR